MIDSDWLRDGMWVEPIPEHDARDWVGRVVNIMRMYDHDEVSIRWHLRAEPERWGVWFLDKAWVALYTRPVQDELELALLSMSRYGEENRV